MQCTVGEQKIALEEVTKDWRRETAGSGCFTAVELSRGHKAEATGSKTMRGDDVDRVRFFLSRGAASPLWNAYSPRSAFPALCARNGEGGRERKDEKRKRGGENGHTSLEHRRRERKSMVPVKVPEVLQTGGSSVYVIPL